MFSPNEKKIIKDYNRQLDELLDFVFSSDSFDKEILANNALTKNPDFNPGFIKKFKGLKVKKNNKFFFYYLLIYFFKSFAYLVLFFLKKTLFIIFSKKVNFLDYKNFFVLDIFLLSKSTVKKNKFEDRYLSRVAENLDKNNKKFLYLPVFYDDGFNLFNWIKVYKILSSSKFEFLTEFQLVSWRHSFEMFIFIFKYSIQLFKLIKFVENSKFSDEYLIYSLYDSIKHSSLSAYVRYIMGREMAKKNNSFTLLSYCEYQDIDRLLFKSLREYSPNVKIIAYQMFRKHEFFMNMDIPEQNKIFGFAPDKVIVNGKFYIPKNSSYEYQSASVRNTEVFKYKSSKNAKEFLLLLPYIESEAKKMTQIFINSLSFLVCPKIKLHPVLGKGVLSKFNLDQDIVADDDFYSMVSKTGVIFTSVGGAALEAISMGISIIIFKDHKEPQINPLIELGKGIIWDEASNSDELISKFSSLMQLRQDNYEKVEKLSLEYQRLFFTNPSSELIKETYRV